MTSPELKIKPDTLRERTHFFQPTSLGEMGIQMEKDDLGLLNEKVSILRIEQPQHRRILILGVMHHPFTGIHLNHFLNTVAPFNVNDSDPPDTAADFDMPLIARRTRLSQGDALFKDTYSRLHKDHLYDAVIGPAYREFTRDHLNRWQGAIENTILDYLFNRLSDLSLVDLDAINSRLYQECSQDLLSSSLTTRERRELIEIVTRAASRSPSYPLSVFVTNEPWYRGSEEIEQQFLKLTVDEQIGTLLRYLEVLTDPDDQKEFFINCAIHGDQQIVVDPVKKEVWKPIGHEELQIQFLDDNSFVMIDKDGFSLRVHFTRTDEGFDECITAYHLPREFFKAGLYPLLAVKVDSHGSTFATQREVGRYLQYLDAPYYQQADVVLGRILAAYCLPDVVNRWQVDDKYMSLETIPQAHQAMMAAQMPVWVSLEHHEKDLLSDEAGLSQKIQEFTG